MPWTNKKDKKKLPAIAESEIPEPPEDMEQPEDDEEVIDVQEMKEKIKELESQIANDEKIVEQKKRFLIEDVTTATAPTLIDSKTGKPVDIIKAIAALMNLQEEK